MVLTAIFVGIGGFIGAIARYLLSTWIHNRFPSQIPLGTIVVNVCGCFILGAVMVLISQQELLGTKMRLLLLTGLIGSFTTFSAVAYETLQFLQNREIIAAISTVLFNLVLGITAILIAHWTIRFFAANFE